MPEAHFENDFSVWRIKNLKIQKFYEIASGEQSANWQAFAACIDRGPVHCCETLRLIIDLIYCNFFLTNWHKIGRDSRESFSYFSNTRSARRGSHAFQCLCRVPTARSDSRLTHAWVCVCVSVLVRTSSHTLSHAHTADIARFMMRAGN